MNNDLKQQRKWEPNPHPEWVQRINSEADCFELSTLVSLDPEELISTACRSTGLQDFGDDHWREPFNILTQALAKEAQLTLLGKLVTRNDLLVLLQTRLRLNQLWRQQPTILKSDLLPPVFIVGLPRSGTSILYELLAQDPRFRVPASWEALFPAQAYPETPQEKLIHRAHRMMTQWGRIAPEYNTMHEMGGEIPCECGMLMAGSFRGDQLAAMVQAPSYNEYLARSSIQYAYDYHRLMLLTLQYQRPGNLWLLKAPNHLAFLPNLFATYPNARVIQTHRDPLKCMASSVNLLGYLFWMRSDQAFASTAFEDIILGKGTAARLNNALEQRDKGVIPAEQIIDSVYQELMRSPHSALQRIYDFLELDYGSKQRRITDDYLNNKPKGKFGVHQYENLNPEQIARERPLFNDYQQRFGIDNEV